MSDRGKNVGGPMAARDWEPRRWRYTVGVPIGLLAGGFLFLKLIDGLLG